jgi:Ca2+-binding EF-hand superfamily protein
VANQVDRDGSGEIEFPEFVELMTSKLVNPEPCTLNLTP